MRIYRKHQLAKNLVAGSRAAVVGYGNQGHAHALNLRDSGIEVVVGARRNGGGWKRAEADGFEPREIPDAVEAADYVAVLLPDEIQGRIFERSIRPNLRRNAALVFAHGFTVAFGVIRIPKGHDVILVAPKGQGDYMRALFVEGKGIPALIAVEEDASGRALQRALSYADAIGCLRAGALETSFREEAVTDLFGEQVVLCGGVPALVKTAFDVLVAGGYSAEVAYLECLHELKIITDLMHRGGLAYMRERISRTAAWGSFVTENRLMTEALRGDIEAVLRSIEAGEFAADWRRESEGGRERLIEFMKREADHPIEDAGGRVRELMPYLKEERR